MSLFKIIRHSKWFDTIYRISIGIKGLDGAVELITGLIIVFSPRAPHYLLSHVADYLADKDTIFFARLADAIVRLDTDLAGRATLIVVIFLLSHGIVKLVLVYCLMRRFYRVYPYAIAILILMLFVQLVPLIHDPSSVAMWFITVLNVLIIYVVWAEYLDLREKVKSEKFSSTISDKKL